VVQDAFDHFGKRRIDGAKALSNKAGGCRLSRPNEIAVPEVRYVSDCRHPMATTPTRDWNYHPAAEYETCSIKPSDGKSFGVKLWKPWYVAL